MKAGRTVTILHAGGQDHEEVINLSGDGSIEKENVAIYPGDTDHRLQSGGGLCARGGYQAGRISYGEQYFSHAAEGGCAGRKYHKTASLKHVLILRKSSTGAFHTEVSLDKISHGKAADLNCMRKISCLFP